MPDLARIGDGAGQAFLPEQQESPAFKTAGRFHHCQVRLMRAAERRQLSDPGRSEEHTSELQSPDHLVCRLLLEKKKSTHTITSVYQTGTRSVSTRPETVPTHNTQTCRAPSAVH